MAAVFVDTAFFVASLVSRDQWRQLAMDARERLSDTPLLTTDEVLVEVLTAFSNMGIAGRRLAAELVREVLETSKVRVIPQSRQSFLNGLARYENRSDKSYSIQDCIAMNVMEAEGITQVLTSDHNFEQEGFTILMKPSR